MILQLKSKAGAAMLLFCLALSLTTKSFAQTITTYTAIANGNYTSASTWQGGNKPPAHLGAIGNKEEHLVIPSGITVTLDTNLHWQSIGRHSDVEINGSLIGLPGYYFTLQTFLKGSASAVINVDSCTLYQSLTPYYNGHIITNYVRLHDFYLGAGTLTVNKKITIPDASGSRIFTTLNIGNHCTIERQGWSSMKLGVHQGVPGVINFPDTMSIIFRSMANQSLNTNVDLDSSWFNKYVDTLLLDLSPQHAPPSKPYTASITQKNLYFNGNMIIKSGNLRLNKNKLTFGPNAKLFCTPNKGMIETDKDAEIVVNATSNFGTGFFFFPGDVFRATKDTVGMLTMNMGNTTGTVKVLNDLYIANKLDLQKGRLHLVDTTSLHINNGATITNASTNSYITNDFGSATHREVTNNSTLSFPVGTMSEYAPIDVKNNSSSMEVYKVGARGGVLDTATKGFDIASQEPCVGATWWVNPTATTGSSADVTFKWPAALEVNSFDRSQSFITTYLHSQTKWDTQTSTSAAAQSGSFYTHTETVNNFSTTNGNYFSVFDGMTSLQYLSVNNISLNGKATLYPNPTSGNATIGITLEQTQTIAVTLTDVSGRVVYKKAATQYSTGQHTVQLPTGALNSGLYFVQLTNKQGALLNSGKLIKQ